MPIKWFAMTDSEKDKKKDPKFEKMENGLIFTSEGNLFVGLPTEIETKVTGEGEVSIFKGGGSAGAEKYSKVKYDWRVITGSPLLPTEMNTLKDKIATTSGTVVTSLYNVVSPSNVCKKCGLIVSPNSKFCSNCGFACSTLDIDSHKNI